MRRPVIMLSVSVLLSGLILSGAGICRGDLVINAEFSTGELIGDRTVAPGETVALNLYASETAGSTQLADSGLVTARLRISPGDLLFAGSTADDAFVSLPELDNPNPINDNTIDSIGDLLVISQGLDYIDMIDGPFFPVFPINGRVRLGTLNLVVPNSAFDSVSFQIEDGGEGGIPGFSGSVGFGGGGVASGQTEVLSFSGTLQVTSVQEPSAIVLLAACSLSSLIRRRRNANV